MVVTVSSPGDRGPLLMQGVEEGRDSIGKDAGASQAGRPDGKCNREQTADGQAFGPVTGKGETVR